MADGVAPAFSQAFYSTALQYSVQKAFHNAKLNYLNKASQVLSPEQIKEPVMGCKPGVDPKNVYLF